MKILMYAPIFPPAIGGPSTQCYSLCQTLHSKGEQVVVLTIGEHFECKSPDGYPVYRYPWKYTGTPIDKAIRWVVFPFYLVKILTKEKPEIVHCHSASVLSFFTASICKLYRIPTVLKFAGDWVWETLSTGGIKAKDFDDLYKKSRLARWMWKFEKWGLNRFDYIWAPSEFRAQNVGRVQGHRKNVRIIYNALDLPEGGYHDMKDGDPFIVVSANRFIPHKRLDMLVRAFSEVADQDSKLILIGTGQEEEMDKVKIAAEETGVSNRLSLPGRIEYDEVYKAFSESSVYVSTSLEEGFPNVFVEAMHFGLPIISTNVGGCHEIVQEGKTGYLYEINDRALLVDRLKQLKNDLSLRNRMARYAYDESHQYELGIVVAQFMDLYDTALKR
jgi:glycosyltransferase involved in cell wall biosynthesis